MAEEIPLFPPLSPVLCSIVAELSSELSEEGLTAAREGSLSVHDYSMVYILTIGVYSEQATRARQRVRRRKRNRSTQLRTVETEGEAVYAEPRCRRLEK